jgi:hypothetical protein
MIVAVFSMEENPEKTWKYPEEPKIYVPEDSNDIIPSEKKWNDYIDTLEECNIKEHEAIKMVSEHEANKMISTSEEKKSICEYIIDNPKTVCKYIAIGAVGFCIVIGGLTLGCFKKISCAQGFDRYIINGLFA